MLRLKGSLIELLVALRALWQAGEPDLRRRRAQFLWRIRIRKAFGFKQKGRKV